MSDDVGTLRIHQLVLPPAAVAAENLAPIVARRLGLDIEDVLAVRVLKESVDARRRPPARIASVEATVRHAARALARSKDDRDVVPAPSGPWQPPDGTLRIGRQPLVVGMGPAGLFAALELARRGYRPILIDRGKEVRARWKDVRRYWSAGRLDPESNVVYGEGGAGTFSDGKVYTRRNDPRNPLILETLARLGQAPDILTSARPHLGTNRLSRALLALRAELVSAGVELRFQSRLEGIDVQGGRIVAATVSGERVATDAVFLGAGHSARDVHELLLAGGVRLEARPIAVGARIEHPQAMIDLCQYGDAMRAEELGASSYMMTWHDARSGSAAHTFCTCPGGQVVAASTEPDGLTVNGMSFSHRLEPFCNSAVVVEVGPADYGDDGPLAGGAYQRKLEAAAFAAGGGDHVAPAQHVADFMAGRASTGSWETSYARGVRGTDLRAILPERVASAMREAIRSFGRRIRGFDTQGHLIAVESRTTSPVRIVRDPDTYQSVTTRGLFPIGEGAGHAGGIVSAAGDGLRAVETISSWVR